MNDPKIHLSEHELALVTDASWILTKQIIIKKVIELFGQLLQSYREMVNSGGFLLHENSKDQNGKISRGENYKELPYVILDYPASFSRDNIFAIRTMFWWSNFFSITLHLSGSYKEKYTSNKPGVLRWLQEKEFSICVGENEWEHHFDSDHYKRSIDLNENQFEELLNKGFFKVAKSIPLTEYHNAVPFLAGVFGELLQFLQFNSRGGEINLSPGFPKADFGP